MKKKFMNEKNSKTLKKEIEKRFLKIVFKKKKIEKKIESVNQFSETVLIISDLRFSYLFL